MKMKRQFKKYIKLFACIMLFGLSIGIIKGMVDVPDDIFWRIYYITSGTVIIGCIIFAYYYIKYYGKKMKEAIKILEAKKPDEYIQCVNALLSKAKGIYLRTLFTINLSAGYSEKKEYKRAIELLESVSENPMSGVLKMIYKLNLCCNYYYDNQREKARSIYQESLKIFKAYRESPVYGGNIAVIDILMELEKENYDLAEASFVIAKSKWNNPLLQEDFLYIEEVLKERIKAEKPVYEQ